MHPCHAGLLAFVVATMLLAGCHVPDVQTTDLYVLELHLVDLVPERGGRVADLGAHCRTVTHTEQGMHLAFYPNQDPTAGPWLAILPELPAGWRSGIGGEPYVRAFPAEIVLGIDETSHSLGRFTWTGDQNAGTLRHDGRAIALPYSWDVTAADQSWRLEATLTAWDDAVTTERLGGYCD